MPISMPTAELSRYGDDRDHFPHVLAHLFRPAVEEAGFELIPPVVTCADLIHAEIIKNLETADLVLCDMTTLNANVFFEAGIRTALDKPIAFVRDTLTPDIPFDAALVNCHTYDAALTPWQLPAEVQGLRQHIQTCGERSGGRSALWKYFGLTVRARSPEPSEDQDKLDLILNLLTERPDAPPPRRESVGPNAFVAAAAQRGEELGEPLIGARSIAGDVVLRYRQVISGEHMRALRELADAFGVRLTIEPGGVRDP